MHPFALNPDIYKICVVQKGCVQYISEFVEVDRDTYYYAIDGFEIGFANDGGINYLHDPRTKVHRI